MRLGTIRSARTAPRTKPIGRNCNRSAFRAFVLQREENAYVPADRHRMGGRGEG